MTAASGPSTIKRLKKLAKEIPSERIIQGLLRILETRHVGSDYPVALIGTSLLERALEAAILSRFVPMNQDDRNRLFNFENRGPIADFASKIRFGAALGLFGPQTTSDLNHINQIRNLFAHSPTIYAFDEEAIADACGQLNITKKLDDPEQGKTPKGAYITACLLISSRLRSRLERAELASALAKYALYPMHDGLLP